MVKNFMILTSTVFIDSPVWQTDGWAIAYSALSAKNRYQSMIDTSFWLQRSSWKSRNPYRQWCIFRFQISPNPFSAGALPRTPPRSLYNAPQTSSWLRRGLTSAPLSPSSASSFPVGPRRCGVRRAHQMVNPALVALRKLHPGQRSRRKRVHCTFHAKLGFVRETPLRRKRAHYTFQAKVVFGPPTPLPLTAGNVIVWWKSVFCRF